MNVPSVLRLTIVIVNYNSWPDVRRLVATLAATPEGVAGTAEVVLVDNASHRPIPEEEVGAPIVATRRVLVVHLAAGGSVTRLEEGRVSVVVVGVHAAGSTSARGA